jgi:N,N-dimethylformamidase
MRLSGGLSGVGQGAIAAARSFHGTIRHYNGKIERPRIVANGTIAQMLSGEVLETLAAWDFSKQMGRDEIVELSGAWPGKCRHLPTRAVVGSNWDGTCHRWSDAPEQWGAIHFHEDDIGDLEWQTSLTLAVPEDWPSGVYALHLEANGSRDNIVFYVRARHPGAGAKVAFLAPTLTYTVYSQFVRPGRQAQIAERAAQWGALPHAPDGHPHYGLSPYNHHSDGSGVGMSSCRRPMIDKRVNQFHLMDPDPKGSGTYWIAADSYIIDLLSRRGIDFEVITDHDVHAEGVGLLARYRAILTGQHPEYHTTETHDAIAAFIAQGGRFVYLGGNGFYWKVVAHNEGPWALELRRAEGGIRLWETMPGESYHAFDGSYGGLWRRLGRPPQALVGVGFSSQGNYSGFPYQFAEPISNPRVSFMRAGLEDATQPGAMFGEQGFMGGGAAGHEVDRADTKLGTPHHALIVAVGIVPEPSYQPVNEERFDHTWPAPREAIIRSDVTFFETPAGGAVFSVGSMNFIGALPVNGYNNTAANLVENVVRRFLDPTPFVLV